MLKHEANVSYTMSFTSYQLTEMKQWSGIIGPCWSSTPYKQLYFRHILISSLLQHRAFSQATALRHACVHKWFEEGVYILLVEIQPPLQKSYTPSQSLLDLYQEEATLRLTCWMSSPKYCWCLCLWCQIINITHLCLPVHTITGKVIWCMLFEFDWENPHSMRCFKNAYGIRSWALFMTQDSLEVFSQVHVHS